MATVPALSPRLQLARTVRERFLAEMGKGMDEVGVDVLERVTTLMDAPGNARDNQARREVWMAYKSHRSLWLDATMKAWSACLEPSKTKKEASPDVGGLELVGAEVVENKILASRMVMAVMDKVNASFDDLRLRMQRLQGIEELDAIDVLRPDVLVLTMVEQWPLSGMPADSWPMVSEVVQRRLIEKLQEAYKSANNLLIKQGVLPTIELKDRVKATVRVADGRRLSPPPAPVSKSQPLDTGQSVPAEVNSPQQPGTGFFGGRLGWGASAPESTPVSTRGGTASSSTPFWRQSAGSSSVTGGAADETRMLTVATPLARARGRAQGVIGQIRRMFVSHGGGDFIGAAHQAPSPGLAAALAPQVSQSVYADGGTLYQDYSPAGVGRVADDLREKSAELKKRAETKSEKATIEIVALMFQAILAEERIPPGIRVWFARLQMPVLRVALEDPDFLRTSTHPARLLIDRMGSCVMGFDAVGVQSNAMEVEVKRIVQVIEQYPETGKKVYQVVFEEFQTFLAKFLTGGGQTQKVVSVAQQVEQKETLAIQYTIGMRNLLQDMPVHDDLRDFLFKVWVEVLAVATMRYGVRHADTLLLKKASADLVWSASPKPSRADRAQVIQDLPELLQRLRSGMTLLAMSSTGQDAHIKTVSDTLAEAFLSKARAIPQDQIDALAERLANLEDFIGEDGMGDLPLDAESIEMMLGIDASSIEVVTNGGSKPTAAMLAWAQELEVGTWYTLDHNRQITQLQFVWCSDRKHLNLFAATSGKSFLIQAGRLAAYLQAGLLLPQEEESLTVRATRDALTKLEANPTRLLA
jgi:hypothetical protein